MLLLSTAAALQICDWAPILQVSPPPDSVVGRDATIAVLVGEGCQRAGTVTVVPDIGEPVVVRMEAGAMPVVFVAAGVELAPDMGYRVEVDQPDSVFSWRFRTGASTTPPLVGQELELRLGDVGPPERRGRSMRSVAAPDAFVIAPDHAPLRLMTNHFENRRLGEPILSDDDDFCARPLAMSWSGEWAEGPQVCETVPTGCSHAPSGLGGWALPVLLAWRRSRC